MIQIGKQGSGQAERRIAGDANADLTRPQHSKGRPLRTILVNSRAFSRSPKFARAVVDAPYFALSQHRLNRHHPAARRAVPRKVRLLVPLARDR
jgi:hypothetical protein